MSDGLRRFRLAATLVGVAVVAPVALWKSCEDGKKATAAAFEGEVATKYVVERHGRRFRTYHDYFVTVQTAQGDRDWEVFEGTFEEIQAGDYVVKQSGNRELAVFRDGEQILDSTAFSMSGIPVPAALTEQPTVVEVPVPVPAMLPAGQAAAAAAAPAKLSPEIQTMLDQASGLWRSGEKSASVDLSEKALYLTQQKHGFDSPESRLVEQKVKAAKAMLAAQ